MNYSDDASRIKHALCDEESEIIFQARIEYLKDQNKEKYMDIIAKLKKDWRCSELSAFSKEQCKKIIIYGCGNDGQRNAIALRKCNIEPLLFCVTQRQEKKEMMGIKIISLDEVINNYSDCLMLVASTIYREQMLIELKKRKFNEKHIIIPAYGGTIDLVCGNQYFDVFDPSNKEVFVDCGAYDGQNTAMFYKWAGSHFKNSYLFEPLDEMRKKIELCMKNSNIKNYKLLSGAVWDKHEIVHFKKDDCNDRSSNVIENGDISIQGLTIDEVIGGKEVTFIKMDVEGAELKALYGAKNTIIKWTPKLAICIYHKAEDIIEIPKYLLQIVPEYKFFVRHYTGHMGETVLYATVK